MRKRYKNEVWFPIYYKTIWQDLPFPFYKRFWNQSPWNHNHPNYYANESIQIIFIVENIHATLYTKISFLSVRLIN